MNSHDIEQILREAGAILTGGHYVYRSWRHGPTYVNKRALYDDKEGLDRIGETIAGRFRGTAIQTVTCPEGVLNLAQWVMHYLWKSNPSTPIQLVVARRVEETYCFGYHNRPFSNVLVVEDIINTGGTARRIVDAVENLGSAVVGVAAIWNRGGSEPEGLLGGIPLEALVNKKLITYDAERCHLCRKRVPINEKFGHGREYLARQQAVMSGV